MDFYEHLLTFMSREEATSLMDSLKKDEIKALRVNSLKVDKIDDLLKNVALKPHKHVKNAFIYNKQDELGKNILFYAGAYYIQEPAAMMAEPLLDIQPGDFVLDMCAAPGGKSFGAAVDLQGRGLLVCNDPHPIRAKILSSNIEKYGFLNTIVLQDDSSNYKKYFSSFFNKIILDAPCSGSGMFRKNEQAKEEWSMEKVMQCAAIQKRLIEDAYDMLKPGGMLLYSTCSFSIQENEEVIAYFLQKHPDMVIVPIELSAQYKDSISFSGGLRLYPHQFEGEGQCIFLLRKSGSSQSTMNKATYLKPARAGKGIHTFLEDLGHPVAKEYLFEFNQQYNLIPFLPYDLKGVKILRYGLELGQWRQNRFIPSHALAMAAFKDLKVSLPLTKEEALLYLKGLSFPKEGNRGYVIVSYHGLPLGFAKQTGNIIKNHYPKGLRLPF